MEIEKKENSLFRKESLQRISSPEKLDDYLRILNPGVWILLSSIIVLLIIFFIWGFKGTVHDIASTNGIWHEDILVCYVDPSYGIEIEKNMHVIVGDDSEGIVTFVGTEPLSKESVIKEVDSPFFSSQLKINEWNIRIDISMDSESSSKVVVPADIVINEFYPIEFLMGNSR